MIPISSLPQMGELVGTGIVTGSGPCGRKPACEGMTTKMSSHLAQPYAIIPALDAGILFSSL